MNTEDFLKILPLDYILYFIASGYPVIKTNTIEALNGQAEEIGAELLKTKIESVQFSHYSKIAYIQVF